MKDLRVVVSRMATLHLSYSGVKKSTEILNAEETVQIAGNPVWEVSEVQETEEATFNIFALA